MDTLLDARWDGADVSARLSIEMKMQREVIGLGRPIAVGPVGAVGGIEDKTKSKSKPEQAWE